MACMSDIDLATLHKSRLEERVNYKLSWWARRLISDKQKQIKNHKNVILSNGYTTTNHHQSHHNGHCSESDLLNHSNCMHNSRVSSDEHVECSSPANDQEIDARLIDNCDKDDDYFTTQRRRRSGTWP